MQNTRTPFSPAGELETVGADALAILEHDHRAAKALLEELPGAQGARRSAILEQLSAALTVHNATEENLVYPAIKELAGRQMHAAHLYHEQDDAKVVLWELSAMDADDPEFQPKAEDLRAAVFEHIDKEEQHEFPHLREAVDAEDLAWLTQRVRAFRSQLRFVQPS